MAGVNAVEVSRKTQKCSKLNRKCPTCKGDDVDLESKRVAVEV
jgi:hypothetical protein